MSYANDHDETKIEKSEFFNSELAVAMGFNLAAWFVVGIIAFLMIT